VSVNLSLCDVTICTNLSSRWPSPHCIVEARTGRVKSIGSIIFIRYFYLVANPQHYVSAACVVLGPISRCEIFSARVATQSVGIASSRLVLRQDSTDRQSVARLNQVVKIASLRVTSARHHPYNVRVTHFREGLRKARP
jgi:hypothetical protein